MGTLFKGTVAAAGAAFSYFYGGVSPVMVALICFVVADYVTGVMAAGAEGSLSSKVGLIGIARKVFIFVMVALGHQIDKVLGGGSMVESVAVYFYLANELLSILENGGRLGVPIPPVITQAVAVLKGKGGGTP